MGQDGSPGLCCPAGRAYSPDESTRHGREYPAAQNASSWGDIRAGFARRSSRGWGRSRYCGIRNLRKSRPPIRIRAECLGKRPEFPRARQRTRSDDRRSRRHLRHNYSEAANPTKDKGPARFHHRKGRRLFLPSGHQGASLPGHSRRKILVRPAPCDLATSPTAAVYAAAH